MASLSLLAELMDRMERSKKPTKSPKIFGARKSYGSRMFKGRNPDAGATRERSKILQAMMGS